MLSARCVAGRVRCGGVSSGRAGFRLARYARRVIRPDRGALVTVVIMAARVPKTGVSGSDGTRPQGRTASRPRPAGTSSRTRISNNTRATSGGRGRRPKGRPRKGRGRSAPRRTQRQPATDPFLILFGWIARVIAAAWMVVAHAAGYAARALGRSAADLDPMHRRDGVGLAFLGAALVIAATTWWHMGNIAGNVMADAVHGGFGSMAWVMPIVLALLAWRYLRHPDRNAETGRIVIGGLALTVGVLGLVHIAHGTPLPAAGAGAIRAAGGFIGLAVSAPLVAALTPWIAAPLLALVCGFGLLVITGTPLHRVPERLTMLRETGADDNAADADDKTARGGRAWRKRPAAIEAGDHVKPYDTPLLGGTVGGPGPAGRKGPVLEEPSHPAGAVAAELEGARDDERLLDALGFGPATAPRKPEQRLDTLGPHDGKGEQLTLTGTSDSS